MLAIDEEGGGDHSRSRQERKGGSNNMCVEKVESAT